MLSNCGIRRLCKVCGEKKKKTFFLIIIKVSFLFDLTSTYYIFPFLIWIKENLWNFIKRIFCFCWWNCESFAFEFFFTFYENWTFTLKHFRKHKRFISCFLKNKATRIRHSLEIIAFIRCWVRISVKAGKTFSKKILLMPLVLLMLWTNFTPYIFNQ